MRLRRTNRIGLQGRCYYRPSGAVHAEEDFSVSYMSETQNSSSEQCVTGPLLKVRMLMGCLLLLSGSYLTVRVDLASCSDQRTESSASSASTAQGSAVARPRKRPVTVADSIQMTRLGDLSYTDGEPSIGIVAKFSPDGKYFVVILKKGNLKANTNEYSLVLFQTVAVFQSPEPQVLVSLASSSNRPAISNVLWLDDNDTILFLGERPGEQTQLYSLKCSSKELTKLTSSATYLTSFVTTAERRGNRIFREKPSFDVPHRQRFAEWNRCYKRGGDRSDSRELWGEGRQTTTLCLSSDWERKVKLESLLRGEDGLYP